MNTDAYRAIRKKLDSSGKEYFDGFSESDFVGLSADEVRGVREIFASRAKHGDGVSLDALRSLMPGDEFAIFLGELISHQREVGLFYAQVACAIDDVGQTQDSWERLLTVLRTGDLFARRWLINKLSVSTIPDARRAGLSEALALLIPDERDQSLLVGESVLLLMLSGLEPRSPALIERAKKLQSPDRRVRLQVISQIKFSK